MSTGSISRADTGQPGPGFSWRHTSRALIAGLAGTRARDQVDQQRRLMQAIVLVAFPAFLLLLSGLIAGLPPREGEIERGVTVAGLAVDGADWERVAGDLSARFEAYLDQPMTVVVDGRESDVTPRQLGVAFDLQGTYENAVEVGRGSFFSAGPERFRAHTIGVDVDPVVTLDRTTFVGMLESLGDGTIAPPTDAAFAIEDSRLVIRPSSEGVGIDAAAAARQLRRAVVDLRSGPLTVPVVPIAPEIATADLEQVRGQADKILAEPLLVTDAGRYWQITPAGLADLLSYDEGKLSLDGRALASIIGSLSTSIDSPSQPAAIVHNGDGSFRIEPEVKSRTLDVPASVAAIERAVLNGEHEIELVTTEKSPAITADSVQPLLERVNSITANGMTVAWSDGEQQLDRAGYADTIVVDEAAAEISFDHDALFALLEPIAREINRPATGYRWKNWEIVAPDGSLPGRLVDINASVNRLKVNALGGNPRTELVVDEQESPAEISADIVIQDLLGTASTYYGNSSTNRRINVEVAAAALDGALVPPGGTFSFNSAIGGTATLDDGYQMGYGIIAGADGIPKTVPSVAGGICQVATTVFQAAFWAGMPIGTRNWHLYWIPNYGSGPGGLQGLDATVDPDYGLDFTFHNPTDDWVAIYAVANGEWMTVEVWGVYQGWEVVVEDPVITNVVKADSTWHRQRSDQVPPGEEVVVEHAQDGFTSTIHRVVKQDGEVIDDLTLTSYYLPSRNVVLVGEGPPLEAPQPQPEPEPVVEEPLVEDLVEEPVVEEPATEEPVADESPTPEPTAIPTEQVAPQIEATPAEEYVEPTPST